jgi:hypothetical protein
VPLRGIAILCGSRRCGDEEGDGGRGMLALGA